jgi:2-methylisocitrate lyase-like PEP mutase family enzyme
VPWLFVNARADTYWLGGGREAETALRLAAYQDAGADGLFVPGLSEEAALAAVVAATALPRASWLLRAALLSAALPNSACAG